MTRDPDHEFRQETPSVDNGVYTTKHLLIYHLLAIRWQLCCGTHGSGCMLPIVLEPAEVLVARHLALWLRPSRLDGQIIERYDEGVTSACRD